RQRSSCKKCRRAFSSRAAREFYVNENGGTEKSHLVFNCGRTQINKLLKESCSKEYRRLQIFLPWCQTDETQKYVDINEAVLEWFKTVRAKKIPVSGPMIQHKAKEPADPLGIENFSVSNLWLDRFRIRNNIICRSLCGEGADVDPSSCEGWQERLSLVLAGYDDKDICSMDEKTLFFRALPNKMIQKHDSKIRRSQR
ncbi:hypothetical protein AVEN_141628-1, partial [Araneus ventricosus]